MHFIESPVFTKQVKSLMSDEQYSLLQLMLASNPTSGNVITNSGGIRKVRWSNTHRGKRGGFRVLYHYSEQVNEIRMLFLFSKNESSDLSASQLRILKQIVENW
ncbi:MAG: toxin HigB-2 [Idiomarina sp. 34-48-12]|nr:MAG: toxin HigB-2 [Idiomarina sp. 34-48-12]